MRKLSVLPLEWEHVHLDASSSQQKGNTMPTRFFIGCTVPTVALVLCLSPGLAAADIVAAEIVAKVGDAASGSTISTLNAPFTDGNGSVGFVASLADGNRIIWHGAGPIFNSSSALPDALTGGEGTMGIGNNGEFIYSPSINGNDGVWTHNGLLAQRGDPAPGIPGQFLTFGSRPRMLPDGTTVFVSGLNPTQGSSSTLNRVFVRGDPAGNLSSVLVGGTTVVDGLTIAGGGTGVDFDYDLSDDGQHHIHVLDMDTDSTVDDIHVYVDGTLPHQEGAPTGEGDNWQNFDNVSINDSGDYVFSGDTDGDTASDEFIAYNGVIVVREGMTIDNHTLPSGAAVNALSMNNLGQVVHIWSPTASERLFFGNAADLAVSSVTLLALNDEIDVDDDDIGDWLVVDFNASGTIGPGLDLADDGFVFVEVGIEPVGGGAEVEAILRIALPGGSQLGDLNCDGVVDHLDAAPFALALVDPVAYAADFPACDINRADIDGSTTLDGTDVVQFVDLLLP